MNKSKGISLFLVSIMFFLALFSCSNSISDEYSLSSEMESEVAGNLDRASSLVINDSKTIDGNPGDYVEWSFSMTQADNCSVKWNSEGTATDFLILVNGTQQGGKKKMGGGSNGRTLDFPAGQVTLRCQIVDGDSAGGSVTFTRVEIKSQYAVAGSTSSSSSSDEPASSSSSSSSSDEPASSSSSSSSSDEPASSSSSSSSSDEPASSSSSSSSSGDVETGKVLTIWYASDSTVRHYEKSSSNQQGVGQRLPEFLTNEVSIANYAKGGRAISSFLTDGFWGDILDGVQPGDVILIQFGINDRGDVPDKEVFKDYLRRYTREARAKKAIPVFVTPTPRLQHKDGVFTNAFTKYCEAKFEVGEELGVTVIDLQTKGRNFYTEIGPDRVKNEMMKDTLHPIKDGAYHMARLLAEGISESNLVPLKNYVITDRLDSDVAQTTDGWNPRKGYSHN